MKLASLTKLTFAAIIAILVSCNPDSDTNNVTKGYVNFGVSASQNYKSADSLTDQTPSSIFISIKNANGELIYNLYELTLIQVSGGYISQQLELESGEYTVEDFVVVNDENISLYLTPKVGSQFESLVNNPLPVTFEVINNQTTPVVMEVIPADLGDPIDFGYVTFSFDIINTLERGLLLHVPFSNDVADVSQNEFNLIQTNIELTSDRHGAAEMATLFNGENSRINVNYSEPIIDCSEFTIAAWVRMDGIGGGVDYKRNIIFQQRDDDAAAETSKSVIVFASEDKDGYIEFCLRSGQTDDEIIVLEVPGVGYHEWHHFVAMLDAESQMKIYLDGVLIGEREYAQTADFVTSIDHVDIGIHTFFDSQIKGVLNGAMDDFRIYNRALTDREVYELSKLE